jgi:hypothetical protein
MEASAEAPRGGTHEGVPQRDTEEGVYVRPGLSVN